MSQALTRTEILALPAAVDMRTAARAMGRSKSWCYEMAAAGEFPIPLLRLGKTYRVRTADLLDLLGIDPDSASSSARGGDVA